MECHNHPDREAVANCSFCGKAVCPECSVEIGGNVYCKDCLNDIIAKSMVAEEAMADSPKAAEVVEEPADTFEPITPIQAEERQVAEEIAKPVDKAPENFETDYEYETAYVETYEEDGDEDSYYENPEIIPEPVPEYREQERKLKAKPQPTKPPIEPIHTGDIDEDYYYEPVPSETPSNELEAKYERYLEDLYYDEEEDVVPPELLEEVVEEPPRSRAPKGKRRRKKQAKKERAAYEEAPRRQRPRDYPRDDGEYYINPRDEYEEDFIVPSHNRRRAPQRDAESYEELKRRIERNYELEQQSKKRGRFRRSKKSKYDYDDYDELENIQEMHRYPVEEESEKLSFTEILLAIILIILILLLILYVIYLFRLSGDYAGFIEALTGLVQNPGEFITNVLN